MADEFEPVNQFYKGPTHRHLKTGRLYSLLGYGRHSESQEELAIYQGADGNLWTRPKAMFDDGRFAVIED